MKLTFYAPDKLGYTITVPSDEVVAKTLVRLANMDAVPRDLRNYAVFDRFDMIVPEMMTWEERGAKNGAIFYVKNRRQYF